MTGRRAVATPLLALMLTFGASACGEPAFEERSYDEIVQALAAEGLQVCVQASDASRIENSIGEQTFTVAVDCSDENSTAVVEVVAWPDKGARDEAIRRFEAQSRPSSQSHGVQLALGQFTIDVSGTRDEEASDLAVAALDRLGAR